MAAKSIKVKPSVDATAKAVACRDARELDTDENARIIQMFDSSGRRFSFNQTTPVRDLLIASGERGENFNMIEHIDDPLPEMWLNTVAVGDADAMAVLFRCDAIDADSVFVVAPLVFITGQDMPVTMLEPLEFRPVQQKNMGYMTESPLAATRDPNTPASGGPYLLEGVVPRTDLQSDDPATLTAPIAFAFNADGTKIYAFDASDQAFKEFVLSTPYDISTAGGIWNSTIITEGSVSQQFNFKPDGSKIFFAFPGGGDSDKVCAYTLSTPWDVSTIAVDTGNFKANPAEYTNPKGFALSTAGDKIYMSDGTTGEIFQYSLSTPWDLTTMAYDSKSFATPGNILDLKFSPDGTKMVTCDADNDKINQYTLSTAWDVSTATLDDFIVPSATTGGANPRTVMFYDSGNKMVWFGYTTKQFNYIELGIPATEWKMFPMQTIPTLGVEKIGFAIWHDSSEATPAQTNAQIFACALSNSDVRTGKIDAALTSIGNEAIV